MAVARGVMGDAARHTTTRRKDRPCTPPIPRWCLLTPCGIRTRRCSARASPDTSRALARALDCTAHSHAPPTARASPHAFPHVHSHSHQHAHWHGTGTCTHLEPRARSLTKLPFPGIAKTWDWDCSPAILGLQMPLGSGASYSFNPRIAREVLKSTQRVPQSQDCTKFQD